MSWWEKAWRELVCLIYRAWGGDCNDLDGKTVTQIRALLAAKMASPGPGAVAPLADRKALADELSAHLANPGNDLSETDNIEAIGMLDDIYAALAAAGA